MAFCSYAWSCSAWSAASGLSTLAHSFWFSPRWCTSTGRHPPSTSPVSTKPSSRATPLSAWFLFWPSPSTCWRGSPVNKPGAVTVSEIGPRPLQENEGLVSESDQKNQVDKEPAEPGKKTPEPRKFQVHYRPVTPNRCHAALVEIFERPGRAPIDLSEDILPCAATHLDCYRRNSRQRGPGLVSKGGHIADGINLRMVGNGEVGIDQDTPGAIGCCAKLPGQRRCSVARRPDHRSGGNELPIDCHAFRIQLFNRLVRSNVDTHVAELLKRGGRKILGKSRQDARRGVQQDNLS